MQHSCDISIIICTYNRAAMLADVLEDIRVQVRDTPSVELILIDNNSSDDTSRVAREFAASAHFTVTYHLERRQGTSIARNTGLAMARGAVIVFTDDDVRLAPDWLDNLYGGFGKTDAVAVAGKVIPVWPRDVPAWIGSTENPPFPGALPKFDLGDTSMAIRRGGDYPFTANAAFRREVIGTVGTFREDLGHRGQHIAGSEDMEFFGRFLTKYPAIMYEPAAVVYHPVTEARLCRNYFFKYLYNAGRLRPLYEPDERAKHLFGVPRYMIRRAAQHAVGAAVSFLKRDAAQAFVHTGSLYSIAGYVAGVRLARRSAT
jgi:glycosyltransferase involved in cell wall biosynthesis